MDENLNFVSSNSWCYDNNPENCNKWGRLYEWNAAMTACPEGWRLPKDEDWNKLISRFGGNDVAGRYLKVDGGSDFDILMAGYRDKLGFYGKADSSAYFWSGTEINEKYASFKGWFFLWSCVYYRFKCQPYWYCYYKCCNGYCMVINNIPRFHYKI